VSRRIPFVLAALLLIAAAVPAPAFAFGKNKIAYQRFDWHIYRSPHFDVYYYPEEEPLLQQVVSDAESQYMRLSQILDHEIKFRIPLIYYKTHVEFEQTNVTLDFIPEFVGAFAEPIENRMVLPMDLPPDKKYTLIGHELTHVFEFSILYQESLSRAFRSNVPSWIMEGLASHLGKDEDNFDKMIIRDAVVNGLIPPIHRVQVLNFLTYRYGQAAFDFIEENYGSEGIRNFLWEFRKSLLANNVAKPIKDAFGVEADEFDRQFTAQRNTFAGESPQQMIGGIKPEFGRRKMHGGETRGDQGSDFHVVETGDRYLPRHHHALRIALGDGPDRQHVVAANHCRGQRGAGRHFAQPFAAGGERERLFDHTRRGEAAAAPGERLAHPVHALARTLIVGGDAGNHRELAMPDFEQIIGEPGGGHAVVKTDARVDTARVERPCQHVRDAVCLDHPEGVRVMGGAKEHQTVDTPFDQRPGDPQFHIGIEFVGSEQQRVAGLVERLLQRMRGIGEDRVIERGDHRADGTRAA